MTAIYWPDFSTFFTRFPFDAFLCCPEPDNFFDTRKYKCNVHTDMQTDETERKIKPQRGGTYYHFFQKINLMTDPQWNGNHSKSFTTSWTETKEKRFGKMWAHAFVRNAVCSYSEDVQKTQLC